MDKHLIAHRALFFLPGCLASALIGGCATPSIAPDYRLDSTRDEGVAIVSLDAAGLTAGDSANCRYRKLADGPGGFVTVSAPRISQRSGESASRLSVIALAPGQYEFYRCSVSEQRPAAMSWTMGSGGIATNSNPTKYPGLDSPTYIATNTEPFSVRFDVQAGKGVYIGNLQVTWDSKAHKATVALRDRAAEDLAATAVRWPQLDVSAIHSVSPR